MASARYLALVEVPLIWQLNGNDAEIYILYGLGRGFQVRTDVVAIVEAGKIVRARFESFWANIQDVYDFDYSEHFTVPNPDCGSTEANAVEPKRQELTVYHRNARRLEKAHLAAPYYIESVAFEVPINLSGSGDVGIRG